MAAYRILIEVDPVTREFSYTNQLTGDDADGIVLVDDDLLVWLLDPSLPERTFQIDFGVLNPFQAGTPVSFRGSDFILSAAVDLPENYIPTRKFKYSVSLGNGWKDDPTCFVVPDPPGGGGHHISALGLSPASTCNITFNANETAISVDNANLRSPLSGESTAPVLWQWDPNQDDTQPFTLTLTFTGNAPAGYPQPLIQSDPESILLYLPACTANFTITTTTPAQQPASAPPMPGTVTVN